MNKHLLFFFLLLLTSTRSYAQLPDANGIVYLKKGGAGNGNSWASATGELADALQAARSNTAITQVWVAGGTYYPSYTPNGIASADARDKTFQLVNNVKVYGGFAGNETALTQRNLGLTANKTILSGDLGTPGDDADNAYHVVTALSVTETAGIDGFTLTQGRGDGQNTLEVNGFYLPRYSGGGMLCHSASPVISNLVIEANYAGAGGGLCNELNSSTKVFNTVISGNLASSAGGVLNSWSSPVFTNIVIAGNSDSNQYAGGAMSNSGANVTMNNSVIIGNSTGVNTSSGNTFTFTYSCVQGTAANAANHNIAVIDPYFVNAPSYTTAPFSGGDYSLKDYSPLIDVGNNSLYNGLNASTTDLLGRSRVDGSTIDIGAVESPWHMNTKGILYVKKGATGAGGSWADPMGEVGEALVLARNINSNDAGFLKQIWVAAGTYYPQYVLGNTGDNRDKTFRLVRNVGLYGGFTGNETDTTQRNIIANPTILSGDLGVPNDYSDNAYHVAIYIESTRTAAVLNGVTITMGNSNGTGKVDFDNTELYRQYGGGLHVGSNSLYMNDVTFTANRGNSGAGLSLAGSIGSIIRYSTFTSNAATSQGGAVDISFEGPALFEYCTFKGNSAGYGGAVYFGFGGNPVFRNVAFTGNSAGFFGSACYNPFSSSGMTFTNVVFAGNKGSYTVYSGSTLALLQHCIMYNNSDGLNSTFTDAMVKNSLIQGIAANAANGNLSGDRDPLFIAPVSFNSAPTTAGDYTLHKMSPVLNKGNNALYDGLSAATTDLAGNPRVYQYALGGHIDMGPYEYPAPAGQYILVKDTAVTYGADDVVPLVLSNRDLEVTLQSSDNNIAEPYKDVADNSTWKLKIKNAGVATITATQAGNFETEAANDTTFTVTVNKAMLTVTAKDTTIVYRGTGFSGGNGVTYSGFVKQETAAVISGTLTYSGSSQGAIAVGEYTIVPGGLSAANYTFTYVPGKLSISKATLIITATDMVKTYDGIPVAGGAAISFSGFVPGDDVSVLGGGLVYSGTSQGAVDAGSYVITPGGYTSDNYAINYYSGTLTISKAALIIRANDAGKPYDGNAYTGGNGVTYTGFVNNESAAVLTGMLTYSGNSQGAIAAGAYNIIPGGLSATNYAISFQPGTLTISTLILTITANDAAKVYDGTAYTGGNGIIFSGFVDNDDPTVLSGTLTYTGSAQGAVNANSYTITPRGFTSAKYNIVYISGTLNISKAPLTAIANDVSKLYDGQVYTGGNGVYYTGLLNNDDATAVTGNPTYSGTSQGAVSSGTYPIMPVGLTAANYTITYAPGTLTIQKVPLMITINDADRCFGTANPAFSFSYSGFVNNETAAVLTTALSVSTNADAQSVAGAYPITATGAAAGNYDITYTAGTLTIHPPLSSTISAAGTVLCGPADAVTLTASGNYTYEWYLDDVLMPGITTAGLSAVETGTYTAKVTDANSCTSGTDNGVTLTRVLAPAVSFSTARYCAGVPVIFQNTSAAGADVTYTWYSGDGQQASSTAAQFTYSTAGDYTAALTITPVACPALAVTATENITVVAPAAGQRLTTIDATTLPVQLTARTLEGATYTWLPGTGLSGTAIYNPVATINGTQEYLIQMEFASGCTTTDTLRVNAGMTGQLVGIANAFSPNGDGLNDLLRVHLKAGAQLRYFKVFNRVGARVFYTKNASDGWDGNMYHTPQPAGAYIWIVEVVDVDGRVYEKKGTVIVVR